MWDIWVKSEEHGWVIFETGVPAEEVAKIITILVIEAPFGEITIKENK